MHELRSAWRRLMEFSGADGSATYLWPRWLMLRAAGIIYVIIFAEIIGGGGDPLIGPRGLTPVGDYLAGIAQAFPNPVIAFLHAPSLLWISGSSGMIQALGWCGLAAAAALVLNLWPRAALFACWAIFLSFVTTWRAFSETQPDRVMLELALVAIAFAPAGLRPGLGASSPPLPVAVFMVRWMLFRLMFEAGLMKLLGGDPHWHNFTAMDAMYVTTPFPMFLSYLDHQLPFAYHVFEIILTFVAELPGPLLAVFSGRRGRWFAFIIWTVFQAGIELTNNFGWLNAAAIILGLALLDDQMLASAAEKLRWPARWRPVPPAPAPAVPTCTPWRLYALRTALWTYFGLSLLFFALVCGMPTEGFPFALARPFKAAFWSFRSINSFTLFAGTPSNRYAVEFEGSNDGGRTWRLYPFRYQPQQLDQLCPVIAPGYARFEAALQIAGYSDPPSPLFGIVAEHLLRRDPAIMRFFRNDPFADRPAMMIRLPVYRMSFTDFATYRTTGQFWRKEPGGVYQPVMYLDEQGGIKEVASELEEVRLLAGGGDAQAQNHLAYLYAHGGDDVAKDPVAAVQWYRRAAEQGLATAQFNLAVIYAEGDGVPKDSAAAVQWYRLAAEQGMVDAQYNLGVIYAGGDGGPRQPGEAVRWFRRAAEQGDAGAESSLGAMYVSGTGVAKDPVEGLAWLILAAEAGDRDALTARAALEPSAGTGVILAARNRARVLAGEIAARKKSPQAAPDSRR